MLPPQALHPPIGWLSRPLPHWEHRCKQRLHRRGTLSPPANLFAPLGGHGGAGAAPAGPGGGQGSPVRAQPRALQPGARERGWKPPGPRPRRRAHAIALLAAIAPAVRQSRPRATRLAATAAVAACCRHSHEVISRSPCPIALGLQAVDAEPSAEAMAGRAAVHNKLKNHMEAAADAARATELAPGMAAAHREQG